MSRKKKSYAEKHSDYLPSSSELTSNFVRENADLWETLRNPVDFEENFMNLQYPRQIALVDLFSGIMRNNVVMSPPKLHKILLDLTADYIERIGWMCGSYYDEGNIYYPLADDEKKLVRMECYGSIDARRDHELSPCYKFFCRNENRGKFKLKDYDLSQSPMWRVFNQFESFREIAPAVRRYLYKNRINPEALKVMSVSDFCDVIHKAYAKNSQAMKVVFQKTGHKKRFVKNFMRVRGKELYKHLLDKGLDERKVASLCRRMSKDGCCDIGSLVITEMNFTPRILKDLEHTQYYDKSFKVGEPIPDELMERMFRDDKESLLLARDEKGMPLDKDDLPCFEVHHKNAVKFANDGDYLAKVNYPSNLMLVEREMHRAYFHGFDSIVEVAKNSEQYFSRVNTLDPNMCLIDGFNSSICYDLENNAAMRKRVAQDKKNVVNYYEMQQIRLNNIPQIADKYEIEYSKNDLKNEQRNLQNVLHKTIDISGDDVQIFTNWVEPNIKAQNARRSRRADPNLLNNKQGNEL